VSTFLFLKYVFLNNSITTKSYSGWTLFLNPLQKFLKNKKLSRKGLISALRQPLKTTYNYTLVYLIAEQNGIREQDGILSQIIKRAGWNKKAGWKYATKI